MVRTGTARDRIRTALVEAPGGLSKGELQRAAHCNPGRFRKLLPQMVESGEVTVVTEEREHGPTLVHKLADARMPGQTTMEEA